MNGEEDVSLWSDEELTRGQRKDKNGTWVGRPPTVVPKALHDELVRRKMSKAFELLRDNVVAATEVLIQLATDPSVDANVRLKAATTIMDRVLGKASERVELTAPEIPPWLQTIRGGIVRTRAVAIEAEAPQSGGCRCDLPPKAATGGVAHTVAT